MTQTVIGALASAKINLALHVTAQREDGYHLLDTLVCFARAGDRIKISPAPGASRLVNLQITGQFARGLTGQQNNLITRAANAMAIELEKSGFPCPPVTIELEKNLPLASGIGGGSSDAATTLVLLADLWGANNSLNLSAIAQSLGADVPMCLDHNPKRARGIGEQISPFNLTCAVPILLVNPGIATPTPKIFAALENKQQPAIVLEENKNIDSVSQLAEILKPMRNDLQKPAISLVPQITGVLELIQNQPGCLLPRMSGSGATCYGIFESEFSATKAMTQIKEAHSDWWSVACMTIAQGKTDNG
ncbi:MAG: 4-(cytidine 5'-diphospho)-2-C-methyl-D-erythritol kinase [Rhizobiaceae bacterium]|nr:4-(cytidine 5'-diphospho)-2-C-methyl-D-erythritol kinase [Rhizobiaceae bacterium]